MALTAIERSLCNSLQQKFEGFISPIEGAKDNFKNLASQFESGLRSISFSPQQDINDAVTSLQSDMNDNLPGSELSDMERLRNFLAQCEFLSGANPIGALLGGTIGIFDKLDNLIDNIAVTVPEFGLAKIADQMNRLLSGLTAPGGSNLTNLFQSSDKLIECVTALCGEASYQSWTISAVSTMDGLYNDFNVTSDPIDSNYGKFDYTAVYNNVGLTPTEVTKMDTAVNGVTTVRTYSSSSLTSAVNAAKSLIGSGGFF